LHSSQSDFGFAACNRPRKAERLKKTLKKVPLCFPRMGALLDGAPPLGLAPCTFLLGRLPDNRSFKLASVPFFVLLCFHLLCTPCRVCVFGLGSCRFFGIENEVQVQVVVVARKKDPDCHVVQKGQRAGIRFERASEQDRRIDAHFTAAQLFPTSLIAPQDLGRERLEEA